MSDYEKCISQEAYCEQLEKTIKRLKKLEERCQRLDPEAVMVGDGRGRAFRAPQGMGSKIKKLLLKDVRGDISRLTEQLREKRFDETGSDKDYMALKNARENYATNIHELLREDGFEKIIIEEVPCELEEFLNRNLHKNGDETQITIIEEGDLEKPKKIKQFKCLECGCTWKADKSKYKQEPSYRNEDYYSMDCPACGVRVYTDNYQNK